MCAHVQARQDGLLGDSRSCVQAPKQAGESDQAEHSHSLVHFGGNPVLQASDASVVDDYEDDLQGTLQSAAKVRSFREGWPGRMVLCLPQLLGGISCVAGRSRASRQQHRAGAEKTQGPCLSNPDDDGQSVHDEVALGHVVPGNGSAVHDQSAPSVVLPDEAHMKVD